MNATNPATPLYSHQVASPERRICIMVLGMHRSGTSALTRAISLLGAALPRNLLGANCSNLTGHWEPVRLIELHDRMLAEGGSRWDDWRAFDLAGLPLHRARHYRAEIARLVEEEYGDAALVVLKEPRISRFASLYAEVLEGRGFDVRCVLTSRNPLAVAASLEKRDGFTPAFTALLWLRYELEAEATSRGLRRVFVSYENLLCDWRPVIDKIGHTLGLDWPCACDEAAADLDAYLSPEHQHHRARSEHLYGDESQLSWSKDTYTALTALEVDAENAEALAVLDRVRAEFGTAARVFGETFYGELDARLTRVVAERDGHAAEMAWLTTEVARLTAEMEQASEAQRRLAEKSEARVTALRSERDDHAAEAERLRATNSVLLEQIRNLETTVQSIYASTSWRLAAPLRSVRRAGSLLSGVHRNVGADPER